MSLARRSITSVAWNTIANWFSFAILLGRAIILARWLPVEVFGVFALANSIVQLSVTFVNFGMGGAFIHRSIETNDQKKAAANYFSITLLFTLVWVSALTIGGVSLAEGPLLVALVVLSLSLGVKQLAKIPSLILTRQIEHRRLAIIKLVDATLTSLIVIWLAFRGATLWALLASSISSTVITLVFLYSWKPIWRPELAWSPSIIRYFLRFGSRNLIAEFLYNALDRVDDLWTGFFLGETPLGFYSRAYRFALYPRRILAMPINAVAGGTYAELKSDRIRLSKAFFRTNAFLVRTGFFLAGILVLIAPELIRIVLGVKWLPMLDAFRLMLIFTLLDPIKVTTANLFIALGEPGKLALIRLVQLIMLIIFLFLLAPTYGIAGVALAVDIMLLAGISLFLWHLRQHIQISIRTLFVPPLTALTFGIILGRGALIIPGILGSPWRTGSIKIAIFTLIYAGTLLLLERDQFLKMTGNLRKILTY